MSLGPINCEVYAARLNDPSVDNVVKVAIVAELRESIEIVQSVEYPRFLALLLPAFCNVLAAAAPAFLPDAPAHKLRNIILEIIHRFPHNDALRPHAADLMRAMMAVLTTDNEDNAVVCLKIIADLHKNFKAAVEDSVQPFLDAVILMYNNVPKAVADAFGDSSTDAASASSSKLPSSADTPPSSSSSSSSFPPTQNKRSITPSLFSFKVLTDCPIIIALLFQSHRKYVNPNVPLFIPYIISVIKLQPPQQLRAHAEAEAAGSLFLGMAPSIKNHAVYGELKSLQVKTISFVAYIIRMFMNLLKPHVEEIAEAVVCLMKDCPADALATRRELLVATRHLWYTEFRSAFVKHIQLLLNDDVLVGPGVACREGLRPLAQSVFTDLIHHVRNDLSLDQITTLVHCYSRRLHDPVFPAQIQSMCAKLLISLIDNLVAQPSKLEAKRLLIRILDAFASRLSSIYDTYPSVLKHIERKAAQTKEKNLDESMGRIPDMDGFIDVGCLQPIRTSLRAFDNTGDTIKDMRTQIKSVLLGAKTALLALHKQSPAVSKDTLEPDMSFSYAEEVDIFVRIFKSGLNCLVYFAETEDADTATARQGRAGAAGAPLPALHVVAAPSKEDKEVLEVFASLFTFVDPPLFQEVFLMQIMVLFDHCVSNPAVIAIPQYFLANSLVSPNFSSLLLNFLVGRLEDLGGSDPAVATVMLRLFKLIFTAVTLFPETNEAVLRPHLASIIMSSLRLSSKAKDPMNYFSLMRSLFRNIGGGRFELLYQEVLPFLQVLLETLSSLLVSAHDPQMKELFVELCLTVPVRLSALLPYLSYLMRPLVIALQGSPEIVGKGLRTFELCVDNLNHEFLESMLDPVIDELMPALWKHLKPTPHNQAYSRIALSIVGKFGGRIRRWIKDDSALDFLGKSDPTLILDLYFYGSVNPKSMSFDEFLDASKRIICDRMASQHLCKNAFLFAKACLPMLIDMDDDADALASSISFALGRIVQRGQDVTHASDVDMVHATSQQQQSTDGTLDPMQVDQEPVVASRNGAQTQGEPTIVPLDPSAQTTMQFEGMHELVLSKRKICLDEALSQAMLIIFFSATRKELEMDAWSIVEYMCRHFAMMAITELEVVALLTPSMSVTSTAKRVGHGGLDYLNTNNASGLRGFVEAIVEFMASEDEAARTLAQRIARLFFDNCFELVGSQNGVERLTVFHVFATRFSSNCFRTHWFVKMGGVLGISMLCTKFNMSASWMLEHELEFVKALLYVLKDVASDIAFFDVEDVTRALSDVIRICNDPGSDDSGTEHNSKFTSLISLLMSELSNSNPTVRECIQSSFQLLAELHKIDVSDILRPVVERLLTPIFAKPLRALPFALQIGHIDAITYCLCLRPMLLTFNDELLRLLHEALALADAEDQALISKTSQFKSAASLNNLRVVCIKLLSAAMACPDFALPRHTLIRNRFISVFFKSLYSKSSDVVETANKGLQQVVLTYQKLPKEILQAGLRPVLTNLSDHKRLTVSNLEGLAKLLELLTNYFKVEIGKKLLDHIRHWAEPKFLEEVSRGPLADTEEIKLIVSILEIFHLLPQPANIYMDELIKIVMEIEARVRRSLSSPFRKPVIKYLNKYATHAADYFVKRLSLQEESSLFFGLLSAEDSEPLREEASKVFAQLADQIFVFDGTASSVAHRNAIHLARHLCRFDASWPLSNKPIVEHIRKMWCDGHMASLDQHAYIRGRDHVVVLQILIQYWCRDRTNIDVVFDIIRGFLDPELVDTNFLKKFVYEEIGVDLDAGLRRSLFSRCLDLFAQTNISIGEKTCMMRYLVIPMLMIGGSATTRSIDSEIIEHMLSNIWSPFIGDAAGSSPELDGLKFELLQLTTLLVYLAPDVVNETRKEVIKFAWNHLKVEDVTLKNSAYALLARFIREYETPSKIVSQIYVALLRGHQAEGRILAKQALDTLLPILPTRLGQSTNERSRMPVWIQWIRKIIVEDGHISSQLTAIYQLLIRNADHFYSNREHFLPQIVSSLARLGLSAVATAETRALTLDLSELVLTWEQRRSNDTAHVTAMDEIDVSASGDTESMSRRNSIGVSENGMDLGASSSSLGRDWKASGDSAPLDYKEVVANYLVRFALSLVEPQTSKAQIQRSIDLFASYMCSWPTVPVKTNPIERTAAQEEDAPSPTTTNAAEVLRICVEHKPASWIRSNFAALIKCVEAWIRNEHPAIIRPMNAIIKSLWKAIDATADHAVDADANQMSLFTIVDTVIQHGLRSLTNIQSVVSLLEASCFDRYDRPSTQQLLSNHASDIIRLFGVLLKDFEGLQPNIELNDSTVAILKTIIRLLYMHISALGELRKIYLQCLSSLLELPENQELHGLILDILRHWILETPHDVFPTIKERSNIAVKMLTLCRNSESAIADGYFSLVAEVYERPEFVRTDLRARLENAFLEATRSGNLQLRQRFVSIFDRSFDLSFHFRLNYVLSVQNWEALASHFWIRQALELMLGSINPESQLYNQTSQPRIPAIAKIPLIMPERYWSLATTSKTHVDRWPSSVAPELAQMAAAHVAHSAQFKSLAVSDLITPVCALLQNDVKLTMMFWARIFSSCWSLLSSRERHDITKGLISLLARDYHAAQAAVRPNVVQALLHGVSQCAPPVQLPPQLLKYLGKAYDVWHISIELLQGSTQDTKLGMAVSNKEEERIRDSATESLAELYADLTEDDYFAGLWRRKSLFGETNSAMSFEQCGMWSVAQGFYESAQLKARTGVLPFTESEYCLWESHWVECAQRLQQWDILTDLAKHDSNTDLLLECAWRLTDWQSENEALTLSLMSVNDAPTARKKMFQAFMVLQRLNEGQKATEDFQRLCDEGIQLVLRRWHALPSVVSNSHIATLHSFQLYVELQEAGQIQGNLLSTNATNIDAKSQELKGILQTWRERMPNVWDDINMWSDLVAWRQHVFTIINKAYMPLIPQISQPLAGGAPTSSYAYRGYHETAWIINRFSHVARKHQLPEVCISSLSKIYSLPNIEIQEAFFKLREQAKCHLRPLGEYSTGLDVINNTNLLYFTPPQKAEFFTLKGIFLSKLGLQVDSDQAFSSAVQIDITLPKAWAAWGEYNDRLFSENPQKTEYGIDAINCYLHASGLYNSSRSRKFLARILWLLSLDDDQGRLAKSYESYKSEIPLWYWITFVPQLINSLSGKEQAFSRQILLKIAKSYPQSLHFQLRIAREDLASAKKQAAMAVANSAHASQASATNGVNASTAAASSSANVVVPIVTVSAPQGTAQSPTQGAASKQELQVVPNSGSADPNKASASSVSSATSSNEQSSKPAADSAGTEIITDETKPAASTDANIGSAQPTGVAGTQQTATGANAPPQKRPAWEIVDEVMNLLKSGFPLLALSMETMVDQILQRLKPTTDEDVYRLIVALLNDGVQVHLQQLARDPSENSPLPAATQSNLTKFADSMQPNHSKYKDMFEQDFILSKPNAIQLVRRFRRWRDNFEALLDRRSKTYSLEHFSHYLAEFEYQKFDDVEVPGQYMELRSNNKDFVRIDRFMPTVEFSRGHFACYRTLTIRGHDGGLYRFTIQHPPLRHSRRDERMVQLFRILNEPLMKKKESRKRNLRFHLPIIVPISTQARLIQNNSRGVTLQDIYETYCQKAGIYKDEPGIFYTDRLRKIYSMHDMSKRPKFELLNVKVEIHEEIATRFVPPTIMTDYFQARMASYLDLWTFRKRFTQHYATVTFMSYLMSIGHRYPQKIHMCPTTGSVWSTDLLPTISSSTNLFTSSEAVPFRLTPNLQHFMTPVGVEGVFAAALMAVGRSLTYPEFKIENYLHIFVRDDLVTSQASFRRPALQSQKLRDQVLQNIELLMRRAHAISCKTERDKAGDRVEPACRTILDLISQAVNPLKLAQMEIGFLPQL